MTSKRRKKTPFRVGDRVVRNKAVGSLSHQGVLAAIAAGDFSGTVVKITPVDRGSGGVLARIRVRWDSGYEGSVEDRQLLLAR